VAIKPCDLHNVFDPFGLKLAADFGKSLGAGKCAGPVVPGVYLYEDRCRFRLGPQLMIPSNVGYGVWVIYQKRNVFGRAKCVRDLSKSAQV
jgi:hypothetical protein